MKPFNMTRDINGYNGFGLPFSDNIYNGTLSDGVEQTLTVPKSPFADYPNLIAIFSFQPGSTIYVALNQTAAVASGPITSGTSEINPAARLVKGGDVLHFITNDSSDDYGVIFYATA